MHITTSLFPAVDSCKFLCTFVITHGDVERYIIVRKSVDFTFVLLPLFENIKSKLVTDTECSVLFFCYK